MADFSRKIIFITNFQDCVIYHTNHNAPLRIQSSVTPPADCTLNLALWNSILSHESKNIVLILRVLKFIFPLFSLPLSPLFPKCFGEKNPEALVG